MDFIKNNIWTILSLAFIALLCLPAETFAQSYTISSGLETTAISKVSFTFAAARNIMFVIGGFGLVAIAFAAIAGKMQWKWVGNIAIGLGIIAAATAVIEYAIDAKLQKGTATATWIDTLGTNSGTGITGSIGNPTD